MSCIPRNPAQARHNAQYSRKTTRLTAACCGNKKTYAWFYVCMAHQGGGWSVRSVMPSVTLAGKTGQCHVPGRINSG
uniref:Uncharacterized protein n=1 Tax=Morganella morganii TaxID=582 RepID=A0A6B8DJU5_MORMO|nr:hypothetical protein [Morganella morganii]